MHLLVCMDKEVDGRFIAEVKSLPGVMVYGDCFEDAFEKAKALAQRVVQEKVAHKELPSSALVLSFQAVAWKGPPRPGRPPGANDSADEPSSRA